MLKHDKTQKHLEIKNRKRLISIFLQQEVSDLLYKIVQEVSTLLTKILAVNSNLL